MDPRDLGRELRDRIQEILDDPSMRGARLARALDDLGERAGSGAFGTLLSMVSSSERPEQEAHRAMVQIEEHRSVLEQQLGRDPGFGVAALDFLGRFEDQTGTVPDRESFAGEQDQAGGDAEAAFLALASDEARRCERYRRPLAIVLLAPDAEPSATGGLCAGAAALRDAARDIDDRPSALSDGLALLLPHTDGVRALQAAERMRAILRLAGAEPWSAGVAARAEPPWEAAAMLAQARQALSEARRDGGDRSRSHRTERRGHPRRSVGGAILATLRREGVEQEAVIEDLSIGGALIRLRRRLDPGEELRLTLREGGPRGRVATLQAVTIRSDVSERPEDGARFVAGLSFLPERGDRSPVAGLLASLVHESAGGERRR